MQLAFITPLVLLLALPALALLIVFRFLHSKRRLVFAGSLLIWKRLAALPVSARPKRVVFDLSLALQAGALLALIAALSGAMLSPRNSRGETILLAIDNGPLSRARDNNGRPALQFVLNNAAKFLRRLDASDRVFLARTAPFPALLNSAPLDPAQALELIQRISPALSGPDAATVWLFAHDRARTLGGDVPARAAIVSLRAEPSEARRNVANQSDSGSSIWIRASAGASTFDNVAIVAAGSMTVASGDNARPRVLVRLANFSDRNAAGTLTLEALDGTKSKMLETRPRTINARAEIADVFRIPRENTNVLRIAWSNDAKTADALPEDDSVVFARRTEHAPRIGFHSPLPALEKLFTLALNAQIVAGADKDPDESPIDLEIYAGSVPESLPEHARAALFVAPERGYRSFFDVGEKTFVWPVAQRGDDSALNAGIASGENGAIAIPKSFEILRTGDFATLLRDANSGRTLAARFVDEKSRPCYVLAFSPGDGLPPERLLDPPLAALLVRMALEASNAGPPYALVKAAELEASATEPLPIDWRPALQTHPPAGAGVLDENASNLRIDSGNSTADADIAAFLGTRGNSAASSVDLAPFLVVLAMILAAAEFIFARAEY